MNRAPDRPHVAAADCERCRRGLVAQPVNAASSLAYVGAGGVLLDRARREPTRRSEVVLAWSAVAAGLGSVAYHGPGGTLGRYVHDAGLLAMLAMVVVADTELVTGRTAPAAVLAVVPAGAALAAHPATSQVAQAVVGGGVLVAETLRLARRSAGTGRGTLEAALAGVAGLAHLLGRTGGPWCRPDSVFQSHALWHVATAVVIGRRARS